MATRRLSIVLIAALAIFAACSTPGMAVTSQTSSTNGPELSGEQIQQVVALHNKYRARHGAPPLTWDSGLALLAGGHAGRCKFEHSGLRYGENIAVGHSPDVGLSDMWYSTEVCNYNWANPSFNAGHFTQVVWDKTTKIGCALAGQSSCPNGIVWPGGKALFMLVCEYDPPGNFPDFAAHVGRAVDEAALNRDCGRSG
ncbi:hypothetical protein FOA52_003103 [Chlamydomonas sp. UWO 241]|nr:hypothetical protein FOA52_003103 [Chlamydomonas sp. UWO 241]